MSSRSSLEPSYKVRNLAGFIRANPWPKIFFGQVIPKVGICARARVCACVRTSLILTRHKTLPFLIFVGLPLGPKFVSYQVTKTVSFVLVPVRCSKVMDDTKGERKEEGKNVRSIFLHGISRNGNDPTADKGPG